MFLEIALYVLVLMIVCMLVFKIAYSLYDSIMHKKPFEEIKSISELESIIGRLKCPRDFYCYKSRESSLSKKNQVDLESFFTCLEEKIDNCTFSLSSEKQSYCKCPLRNYISNQLNN